MKLLKQSTAATIVVGPVLDSSGAAVTTAVVGDFRISKNGTAATLSGATVTHDANGYYAIALTTGNTDTVGRLVVYSGNTAQSMATHHWTVLLASVFDALQSNATNATGGLVTATAAVTAMAGAISTLTASGVRTELTTELGRIDATISSRMATYTQPTGFLAATFPTTVSSYAGGAVASVTGSVGSVVARVAANTDQWGGVAVTGMPLPTSSYTTPPAVSAIVTGVYAALPADHTVSGSYGVRLLLALNSSRELQLTGSHHAAADVHEFQTDVITDLALATSAISKIQAGLATLTNQVIIAGYLDTEVAAIKIVTDKINTGLVADGAVYQYTANMLELAPSGGGGAGDASQATLLEVQDTVEAIAASLSGVPITATGRIADGGTITLYCGDDLRVRSGTQLTIQVSDVGGAIYDRLNAAGVDLAWGASRRGLPASAISGTVASLTEVGSGETQSLAIVIEIVDGGASLQPAEDYTWQIESEQQHSAEVDQLVEVEGSLVLRRRVV